MDMSGNNEQTRFVEKKHEGHIRRRKKSQELHPTIAIMANMMKAQPTRNPMFANRSIAKAQIVHRKLNTFHYCTAFDLYHPKRLTIRVNHIVIPMRMLIRTLEEMKTKVNILGTICATFM